MSTTYRRPRGAETEALNMFVAPDVKRSIEKIAAAAGAPQWAVVEAAIRAGKLGPDGIPTSWDLPHPSADTLPGVAPQDRKTA